MQGRQPAKLILKRKDLAIVQQLLADGDTGLRVARRAQILLARAGNQRVVQVVAKVDQQPATVWRVCERYRQGGLAAALYDAPRLGRPPVFSPAGTPAKCNSGLPTAREGGVAASALVGAQLGARRPRTGNRQPY
jgi:hypothetical protein